MIGVDVHVLRDFGRDGLAVARQHDNFVDAIAAHLVQRLLHGRTNRVFDADDAEELRAARDIEQVLACEAAINEAFRIFHAVFREKFLAADADRAALIRFEVRHLGEHAARDDGLAVRMLRRRPAVLPDVFLDGHGERMDGMLLGRCREQNHFFFIDAFRRARERNLRDTDRQRARLVEHDGVRLGQRLDVVATLDEDAALRGRRNRRRNRCRRRELQAARKVNEQQVQHALPVARRAIDDGRAEERDRHEEVRHLVGEVLHGRLAALRLLDEVDDMRETRVLADFLNGDDELARLDDGARIDGRILMFHGRIRLARNRRLVDGSRTSEHAAVDDDLLARMRRNRITRTHLLDGNLALDAILDAPDIALIERKQPRNLRARTLGRVARQHFRAIRERQQRQARLGLACEHGRDDRRRRQRVGVEASTDAMTAVAVSVSALSACSFSGPRMPFVMNFRARNTVRRLRAIFVATKSSGDVLRRICTAAKPASDTSASRRYSARRSAGVTAASCAACTTAMICCWISRAGNVPVYQIRTCFSSTSTAFTMR